MDKTLLVFVLGIVLFVSPLVSWWPELPFPWYAPYVMWAMIIALAFLTQRSRRHHER
ncbi:hypothetical protein [Ectothiorhodosinus mongolicus]|nr:hypothetical protein [Ectothiorhodosinus mongolicus]